MEGGGLGDQQISGCISIINEINVLILTHRYTSQELFGMLSAVCCVRSLHHCDVWLTAKLVNQKYNVQDAMETPYTNAGIHITLG